jgi:hypothetical protein
MTQKKGHGDMKQVSTNHPSLRGVSCYDCGNDTARHGYLDEIDSAFFCQSCYNERHPRLSERKKTIGDRRWPNYRQRIRKARRRNLIVALAIMFATAYTDNALYVYPAFVLVIITALPYMNPKNK